MTDLPAGGPFDLAELDARWQPWMPAEAAARLDGTDARWCVAAGWALDLFLGGGVRDHEDLELAVPRADFEIIRADFAGFQWDVVGADQVWQYNLAGDHPDFHQIWLRDPETELYHLDVFREPDRDGRWLCRHDTSIVLDYDELILHTDDGIPFMTPEVVLLFKSRSIRPKDDADFDGVVGHLTAVQSGRLRTWLAAHDPAHPWLVRL